MNEYKAYSKDIWDYLGDISYMPSRADRDKLLASDDPARVQIWDFFFQIKASDVGKPQKEEISRIEKKISEEISKYTQRQKEIRDSILKNKIILFWKRVKNFLYGIGCSILSFLIYRYTISQNIDIDTVFLCVLPFVLIAFLLWLGIIFVGRNEKRLIKNLKIETVSLHNSHNEGIRLKIERKQSLKFEIKELVKQIPTPPTGIEVDRWLNEHLDAVIEDSKRATGLVGKDLITIDAPNPIAFSGPGELQDPKRFPPTFTKIRASDDVNFDIKKHLSARRAFEHTNGGINVLYGVYYLECILIAKDMLATYGLFYDFITGKSHAVETTEQYYNDIVSIIITDEFRTINKVEKEQNENKNLYIEDAPTFTMSLSSGENRTVTFVSEKYFLKIKEEIDVTEENVEKIFLIQDTRQNSGNAIKALRKQLRSHKKDNDNKI